MLPDEPIIDELSLVIHLHHDVVSLIIMTSLMEQQPVRKKYLSVVRESKHPLEEPDYSLLEKSLMSKGNGILLDTQLKRSTSASYSIGSATIEVHSYRKARDMVTTEDACYYLKYIRELYGNGGRLPRCSYIVDDTLNHRRVLIFDDKLKRLATESCVTQ
jgi:hypothetical protein